MSLLNSTYCAAASITCCATASRLAELARTLLPRHGSRGDRVACRGFRPRPQHAAQLLNAAVKPPILWPGAEAPRLTHLRRRHVRCRSLPQNTSLVAQRPRRVAAGVRGGLQLIECVVRRTGHKATLLSMGHLSRWIVLAALYTLARCAGFRYHGEYCGPRYPKPNTFRAAADDLDVPCQAHHSF